MLVSVFQRFFLLQQQNVFLKNSSEIFLYIACKKTSQCRNKKKTTWKNFCRRFWIATKRWDCVPSACVRCYVEVHSSIELVLTTTRSTISPTPSSSTNAALWLITTEPCVCTKLKPTRGLWRYFCGVFVECVQFSCIAYLNPLTKLMTRLQLNVNCVAKILRFWMIAWFSSFTKYHFSTSNDSKSSNVLRTKCGYAKIWKTFEYRFSRLPSFKIGFSWLSQSRVFGQPLKLHWWSRQKRYFDFMTKMLLLIPLSRNCKLSVTGKLNLLHKNFSHCPLYPENCTLRIEAKFAGF